MAVNHNINVLLSSKGRGSNKTPVAKVEKITNKNNGKNLGPESLSSQINTLREQSKNVENAIGTALAGAGVVFALDRMVKTANKIFDIGLEIGLARTGENVAIGNIKRIKSYVLKPKSYIVDLTYGKWLRNQEISRREISSDYERLLSGNLIVGKQYGSK